MVKRDSRCPSPRKKERERAASHGPEMEIADSHGHEREKVVEHCQEREWMTMTKRGSKCPITTRARADDYGRETETANGNNQERE